MCDRNAATLSGQGREEKNLRLVAERRNARALGVIRQEFKKRQGCKVASWPLVSKEGETAKERERFRTASVGARKAWRWDRREKKKKLPMARNGQRGRERDYWGTTK